MSYTSILLKYNSFIMYWGFPGSSAGKESTCNAGDPSLIPESGRSPGEGIGYPLQYSWASLVAQLVKENSMDCIVHGVTKSQTRLSNFHSLIIRALYTIRMSLSSWVVTILCFTEKADIPRRGYTNVNLTQWVPFFTIPSSLTLVFVWL